MAPPLPRDRSLTIEEYLAFDDASAERHEFVDGQIYALSGVTRRHSRIVGNIAARVWAAARGGPCRVHAESVRLRVGGAVYYPDVMVACGPEPADERVEESPCLVVEVTSPSSERADRTEKAMVYRSLASLGAYLVVDQERRRVDHFWRDAAGWRQDVLFESGTIPLPCPTFALTLDEIFEGVQFPPPEERRRVREDEHAFG